MRSITAFLALLIIVLSCGKRDQGELIGVKTKKFIRVNPHGMVEVPGGSFIMGSSDEDIIDVQNDITRTMTIRTFYMDETEITNREYMQFIEWVKDSIVRTKLAEKAVMVFEGMYEDNGYERGTTSVPADDVDLFYSVLNDPDELEEVMPTDEQLDIAENQSLEDLYNTTGGEILRYYPAMEDFIGDPEEDLTNLNGYQQLIRFRAQNPVKLWLSTRTFPDSVFHHSLPFKRDEQIFWEREDYPDIHYAEVMEDSIYLPENEWYNGVKSIDTKKLIYRFDFINFISIVSSNYGTKIWGRNLALCYIRR